MKLDLSPQPLPLAYDEDGNVRVGGTRVTLDSILACFKHDESPEEIAYDFDTVGLANIYVVIAYYLGHKAEVDAYLEQQERDADAIWQRIDAETDREGWRERLLARRAAQERPQ